MSIKSIVRGVVVAAMAALGLNAWAEATTSKVISFNWSDESANNATAESGVFQVAAGAWNNFSANGNTRTGDLNMWDGSTSVNAGSNFSITWSGSGWYGSGASEKILNRYLDDGRATTVTVSNIPFQAYDVYIYCATDTPNAKFAPWTVNGITYGSPNWGDANSRAACVVDANTIKVAKQIGTLTIVGSGKINNTTRGTLAAIQIVETEATIVNQNVGSAYTATEAEALEGDIFNLTFDADATFTLDKDLTRNYSLISEGAITLAGDHVTAANLAKLGVSGVEGGIVRVIDTASIPEGLAFPTAGWTYVYAGTTALSSLPFATTQYTGNAGTIRIACPISSESEIGVLNNKNYVFAEGFSMTADKFVNGNKTVGGDPRPSQSFVQEAGTITLNATYTGNDSTTAMPFLLGHYPSDVTYTLKGGSIECPNGNIMYGRDGSVNMTVGGGDTTATLKALGIKRNGRDNAATLTIAANGIVEVGAGSVDLGTTKKLAFAGGTLKMTETGTITSGQISVTAATTIEVAADKVATLDAVLTGTGDLIKTGAGTLIISKVPNNYTGAIRINEGALDAQGNRNLQNVVFAEGATLIARGTTADDGTMTITGVSGNPTITLYDALGNAIPAENISYADSTITATFTPAVSGKGCWIDYEFKGDMTSVGTDTTALTRDGSDFGENASSDFEVDEEGNAYALYTGTHPHRFITYPTEWSCAIYCSVPDHAKAALITFGTKDDGLIGLISGTKKDQVLLVRTTGNSAYEVLATMAVPNAATAQHLYTFTKTAREIKVYLDGKLWTTYTSTSDITFGGGMQIASVHGGVGSTGIVRFDKALFGNDARNETLRKSLIGMMRLYNAVLGSKAAKILSDEFSYVSPNGLFTREVSEDGTWSQEGAWSKVLESSSEAAAIPEEGAVVKIATASDETVAKVTVNVESDRTTEELEITGGGIIAFDVAEGSGKISNSGATTIDAAVTNKYGALDISGGPLTLGSNGSISFDLSDYSFESVYAPTTIFFTGITKRNDELITAKVPSPDHGRALTFAYDTATQRYVGVLYMEREAGDLAIGEGDVTITDSTVFTDADGNETVRFYDEDWIVVSHEQTVTIGENLTHPAKIKVVNGGVLKLNFASGVTKPNNAYNATVRVEEGGVYDVAGHKDYSHPIILAGGTLMNSGVAATTESRQYWQNSVVANSTIDVSGNEFGAVNNGHAAYNYTLGGYTLTKTGAGQFTFQTANFVGGGTLNVQAGTLVLDNCTVPAGVKINLAIASGAEVIVNNALTKAALGTITGSGTFTYTGSVPATAAIAENGSSIFQNANWTGTVKISGVPALNDWDLGAFGSGGVSKVAAINVKGYSPASNGCNAELVLNDSGDTKALLVNNGYSNGDYFFAKVSGSGTFGWDPATSTGPDSGHIYRLKDISGFTGKLDTGAYLMIVLGLNPGTVTCAPGVIQIEDGLTITANNWTAQSVIFGATLKVKGSVGDAIVTATTLPETMPAVTLVDAGGTEVEGYTLKADENGTLKVVKVGPDPIDPSSGTTSVEVKADSAPAACAAVTIVAPSGVNADAYVALFKKTATLAGDTGKWTVTVELDEEKVDAEETTAQIISVLETAEGDTLALTSAKPGLYYQLVEGATLNAMKGTQDGVRATSAGVTLTKTVEGASAFFRIRVSAAPLAADPAVN